MSPLRRQLLSAYYHATLPARRVAAGWAARRGQAPIHVLFYHRVADDLPGSSRLPGGICHANEPDAQSGSASPTYSSPWTLSNDAFTEQIDWLRANFDLVSLEEAQGRIRSGVNHRPAVSITFDDGYADNCEHALPLLVKYRIPCQYFVTVNNVFFGDPFPHDAAIGQAPRPNTLEQLRTLAAAGIEIGAHTRTHSDLGSLHDAKRLRDEVIGAARDLAAALDRPVRYFAFPFGQRANLNPLAFRLAQEFGFAGVCSAYGGYNFPGDDPFHLQRIHADSDLLLLKNWLTGDLRKRFVKRYEYEAAEGLEVETPQRRPSTREHEFPRLT